MLLKIKNLLDESVPTTYLTSTVAVSGTTLPVQNPGGFTDQWAVQIGKTGEEKTEIVIGTTSGNTAIFSPTVKFAHPTDTPVYAVKWNQVIFKRSTSGTSGTASAFATTNITPDSDFTQYDDTAGASTYAYRASYYNSVIGTASSDSDWLTVSGHTFYSLAGVRDRVKNSLFDVDFIGGDGVIDQWINEYLEVMTNALVDVNKDYALGSTTVSFSGTTELGTITATDFKQVRRVWMTSNGTDYYVASKMEAITPRPNQIFNETSPYFYMHGDNVISRWPHDTAGTASILYYKFYAQLDNETDELPVPMQTYSKGFVDYALMKAYQKDKNSTMANEMKQSADETLFKFKREMTPRVQTGSNYIDIVEGVGEGIEEFWT